FSPLNPFCEEQAAEILREECPGVAVTLSHRLGRLGLLERENATLLNAALVDLARKTTRAFTDALRASGIAAPLYLTQNDGTVMLADVAEAYPVYSFASGPTNSMRGAAFLSRLGDALVVDVGGTTTDVGALRHGFPREANNVVEVGGVRTLFRMPDLLSLGLGGGSHVTLDPLSIGPVSVGYRLTTEARVFGGATIAQVSGEVDQIFQSLSRDEAIARARAGAEARAVTAGAARDSLRVVEVEDLPLAYLPGSSLRVRVRVVGEIAATPALDDHGGRA